MLNSIISIFSSPLKWQLSERLLLNCFILQFSVGNAKVNSFGLNTEGSQRKVSPCFVEYLCARRDLFSRNLTHLFLPRSLGYYSKAVEQGHTEYTLLLGIETEAGIRQYCFHGSQRSHM